MRKLVKCVTVREWECRCACVFRVCLCVCECQYEFVCVQMDELVPE
jgi:hypothetical protein